MIRFQRIYSGLQKLLYRSRLLQTAIAEQAKGPGSIYFTGGTTALMLGIREQTIDGDLKLDPEPLGIFQAISALKEELQLNIELAAPSDFIPAPPDWKERSILIKVINNVKFYHFDLTLQALAKIERGHAKDISDVNEMLKIGAISVEQLTARFSEIEPMIYLYPIYLNYCQLCLLELA